jgi:hypothetical protein
VPLPLKPKLTLFVDETLAFHEALVIVTRPLAGSDGETELRSALVICPPFRFTTTVQPVVGELLVLVSVTLARYPVPQSLSMAITAESLPSELVKPSVQTEDSSASEGSLPQAPTNAVRRDRVNSWCLTRRMQVRHQ